jgi:hypothetical protein
MCARGRLCAALRTRRHPRAGDDSDIAPTHKKTGHRSVGMQTRRAVNLAQHRISATPIPSAVGRGLHITRSTAAAKTCLCR